ncbi:uncharacterized protein LOC125777741 [Bactrocera dorsalis]|uniref:Uncharacterized protein LOC125777741 n=1 Tax=Bactrocera dorsalis TaxID=27457 RepID=A0ABM3JIR2_BACDO|nr:uncharacterized protein LOC125777741 [Bactrocera dorsalis]
MKDRNQNNVEPEEPTARRFFRPWEDRDQQNEPINIQRPDVVVPPAENNLNYYPQPAVPTMASWNKFKPCFFYGGMPIQMQAVPTAWPSRATSVSTHAMPQPLPVPTPNMRTMAPQMSQRKRKRVAQDMEEEQLVKRVLQMSREQIEKALPYRREMARTYAPKERTPAEQRKRDKNTEACRLSRRRKKLFKMLKEQNPMCVLRGYLPVKAQIHGAFYC